MPSLVFHRGLRTFSSAAPQSFEENSDDCQYNFISFLAMAQKLKIGFVPTTWYSGSTRLGHGATSQVHQSKLDVVKGLAFKKLSRQCQVSDDQHYASLVSEMLILRAQGIVDHPNIAKLIAVAWEVPYGPDAVWPVLVSDRAQFGTLSEYCLSCPPGESVVTQERLRLCIETARAILTLHSCSKPIRLKS